MDRPRLLTARADDPNELMDDPLGPSATTSRSSLEAPTGAASSARSRRRSSSSSACSLKLGSLAKFAAIFVAFGGYALIWGWKFGLGVVVLIFVHEMGHFLEAKREGLHPALAGVHPVPRRLRQVHARQPVADRARRARRADPRRARRARLLPRRHAPTGSGVLVALGYFGFFINLFNLLPIGDPRRGRGLALDALALARRRPRQGDRSPAALFAATAILLAIGAFAAYLPQHRL